MKDSSTARKYHIPYDSEMVEEFEATARTKDLTVNAKVYFGDARVKIVEAVAEHKIGALVKGNRGTSGIKRIFLGSVSNYVCQQCALPSDNYYEAARARCGSLFLNFSQH
ncbi:unnamed protein product [Calypogeia fissa]